jgi:gamma-glutamyltranspeptidase/glutathione hydrolase
MRFSRPPAFTTRPTLEGTVGMAASTHWAASATAMGVLERGGTAVDAAVAAGFVLQVVEPHLNGPGGDLTAVFTTADDPTPRVLDGQGPAPAAASAARYRDEGLDRVPGAGALASAIPGATDAWLLLLRDHGTWEVGDVVAPAIGYARDGFPAVARVGSTVRAVADLFREHWPSSAALCPPPTC